MTPKIKQIANNPVLSGTLTVTAGVFIGSIFSYLLQIGLGYLLPIEDFGTFNALLSLAIIFGIPSAAISTSLIKKVGELLTKEDFYSLRKLFWGISKIFLGLGGILALLFLVLDKWISGYFNLPPGSLVYMYAAFLAMSFINVAPLSYLQGLLRFKAYAFITVFSQFIRLVIPLLLVYIGLSLSGAYLGLTLVAGISFLVSIGLLSKNLKAGVMPTKHFLNVDTKELYHQVMMFSIPVLFINSGVALLNNVDIVMAKHFLSPLDAGIYSGVVAMGKVFLFGAGIVQVVMFPQISNLFSARKRYQDRFLKFLLIQVLMVGTGILVYTSFPGLISQIMFRGKFSASVQYLPLFAVFTALYIMLSFLSMFLLSINKTKAYLIILPACILQYALINLFHSDIGSIIQADVVASALACLFISGYTVKSIHESINHHTRL